VKGLACGGTGVVPARLHLPERERCPYGTYVEADDGTRACVYPVTQLAASERHVARACRAGTLAILELGSMGVSFFSAGHLATLTFVGGDLLLLGRAEGQLRLYQLSGAAWCAPSFPRESPPRRPVPAS